MEPSCDTLFMCFITTFKEGIRAGGGISDVLRKPASHVRMGRGRSRERGGGWREEERERSERERLICVTMESS
jgi:hypothetical protein